MMTAPPLPVIPERWHGKKVVAFIAVSAGPVDDGAGMVGDFRTVAEPIADLLGPMPYTMIQSLIDPLWPKGINAYFKATNLASLRRRPDRRVLRAAPGRSWAAVRDPRPPDGRRRRARP